MIKPFYVGQKVVCISSSEYGWNYNDLSPAPGPKKDEVCTVVGYDNNNDVLLGEYLIGEGYDPKEFRALEEMKFPLITYSKVLEEQPLSAN